MADTVTRTLFKTTETTHYQYIDDYVHTSWRPWTVVGSFLSAALLIIGTVIFISYRVDVYSCDKHANGLHLKHRFDFWASTCFVTLSDGRQVDIDLVRFNEQGQIK